MVEWCSGVDLYQNQTYAAQAVHNVHLQPTSAIVKSNTNTDEQLVGILFVDARYSEPKMDWRELLNIAHENGGDLRITVRGQTYTALTADELRDDTDKLHHWEIGVK